MLCVWGKFLVGLVCIRSCFLLFLLKVLCYLARFVEETINFTENIGLTAMCLLFHRFSLKLF
ncbi:unnamed protein product [Moneuplotes crassus]|uniref:Uncharacterized protein n=1 Tax=Euplotes crassus TaxID=5936 RepID=A0AAD1Y3V6_EUPCR|nr:unnamed protein product [Moneuplotes crassus]